MQELRDIWKKADAICFDVDSTIIPIEVIDELARTKGVYHMVSTLTSEAMNGICDYTESLQRKLDLIKPTRQDIEKFIVKPLPLTSGVQALFEELHSKGKKIHLISGGFRCILEPLGARLGVSSSNVHCNRLLFHYNGDYAGLDMREPTVRSDGKALVIEDLKKNYGYSYVVHVGDGVTDLVGSPPADAVIGFGGVVCRTTVFKSSKYFIYSFNELMNFDE